MVFLVALSNGLFKNYGEVCRLQDMGWNISRAHEIQGVLRCAGLREALALSPHTRSGLEQEKKVANSGPVAEI
jgi:hypothetical protein